MRSLEITWQSVVIFSIKVMGMVGGVGSGDLFRMDFTSLEQLLYLSFSF